MSEQPTPMAPGGVWLHYNGRAHYAQGDHIARLLQAGAWPIEDPRITHRSPVQAHEEPPVKQGNKGGKKNV